MHAEALRQREATDELGTPVLMAVALHVAIAVVLLLAGWWQPAPRVETRVAGAHSRGEFWILGKRPLDLIEQPLLVLQHVVAVDVREAVELGLLHRIERLRSLLGQGRGVAQARDPVVHAEREQLAPQHLRGLQEDAGRRHLARNHLLGLGEEVQVVRAVAVGQRGRHRIAVTPARAAHALQEAGLVRWH